VEKGTLSYDDKISKYWPEFIKNGKEDIQVKDVLRHEGGIPRLTHIVT